MTKRKINLFGGPLLASSKRTRVRRMMRTVSIIASLAVFAVILLLYLYRAKLLGDIASVREEQIVLQTAIDKEAPRQKDLQTILERLDQLQSALSHDVRYASKSALIESLMDTFPARPIVDRIVVHDPTSFALRLQFASQRDMLDFIRRSEDPSFGTMLKEHSIGIFRVTTASDSGRFAELEFSADLL